jgi:hypothetical protein
MDAVPEPSWTTTPKKSAEYFFGMNSSFVEDENFSLAVKTSKQKAIKDLSSFLKVNIKSQLTSSETLSLSGQSVQDIESLFSLSVETMLEKVEVDDIWLDQEKCQLWTSVKIEKNTVKRQKDLTLSLKLLALFQDAITQSSDPNLDYLIRIDKVKLAKDLFSKIKFELLTTTSKVIENNKLSSIEASFSINIPKFQHANMLLNKLKSINIQFLNLSDKSARSKLALKAKSVSFQIQEKTPINSQMGVAEQALAFIAEIEKNLNNSCAAKTKWQAILKNSQNTRYLKLAQQKADALSCSEKALEKATILAIFEGKKVRLWCSIEVKNKIEYWKKACDNLKDAVTQYGAVVSSSKQLPNNAIEDLDKIPSLKKHIDISLLAKGAFQNRKNPENPNEIEYRFKGKIKQQMSTSTYTIMGDSFKNPEDWSSVSEDISIDLLALNLAKRFKTKLASALKN